MEKQQKVRDHYTYSTDGREISLDAAEPQRRFDNMLYNRAYFMIIDQCGNGPAKHMVAEGYINNVVAKNRLIYVHDDETGEFFSIGYGPVYKDYQSYRCTSGLNYQIIENTTAGLKFTWRIFVPAGDDPVEIWDLRVENTSGRARRISLFSCVEMNCDGVDTYGGPMFRYTDYYPDANAIFIRADAEKFTEIDFPFHNGFITADRVPISWECDKEKFIGPHRTLQNPLAVEQGKCDCNYASMWTPTGSLHFSFELGKAGTEDVRFILGACDGLSMIKAMRAKYLEGSLEKCPAFDALAAERAEMMRNIEVETPNDSINRMLNIWGKQQSHYLATWCRWGYVGYRDIVQMSQGVLYWDTELARRNLKRAFEHQYNDGFALRGWNPFDPMRYVDGGSWLISAVTEYIKETADFDFLDEVIPYLDGGEAPVYEHLMQIMRRLHTDRGEHGLCLAFFGDWNDSLTGVCRKGKGQSVWMSMAFCRCAVLMAELAEYLEKTEDLDLMNLWHKEMADAVNKSAWDGRWYICALDDDGQPIGSAKNKEGKIFLNMQSWAQLGRICSDRRWVESLSAVDEYLDSGWGPMLSWPVYTKPDPNVGRLSYLRPGICENGTVYTHGVAFLYLAFLERGLADRALKLWRDIHPENPNRPLCCQPNVFANGFRGPDSDTAPGEAEHLWTTGSASWMISCTIEFMLGLRRTYNGLMIRPTLPSDFSKASITRSYRGTSYCVTLNKQKSVEAPPAMSIMVDGAEHPIDKPLPIDGARHEVVVTLG